MTASEKVAYLKGLAEGLGIDKEDKEGRILTSVIDVLGDLSKGLEDMEDKLDSTNHELEAVSEDLTDIEDCVFGDGDEDDDDSCSCGCEDEDDEDDDKYDYEVTCPSCNEEILLDDDDMKAGVIQCPNCGETLELELDESEEDGEESESSEEDEGPEKE